MLIEYLIVAILIPGASSCSGNRDRRERQMPRGRAAATLVLIGVYAADSRARTSYAQCGRAGDHVLHPLDVGARAARRG